MDFELTAGKRFNSSLIYCEKQLYSYKSTNNEIKYYECYLKCGVRIKVVNGQCSYVNIAKYTHTHGDQELAYKQLKVEEIMKIRSGTEKRDLVRFLTKNVRITNKWDKICNMANSIEL